MTVVFAFMGLGWVAVNVVNDSCTYILGFELGWVVVKDSSIHIYEVWVGFGCS